MREQLDETDRVDLVDGACPGVVAGLRHVARHGEHVSDALGVRAEQERLEPVDRRVARRQVRDRLDPGVALDRDRGHQPAHARSRARIVVHVDDLCDPRRLDPLRGVDEPGRVSAERRIELHRDDEPAGRQQPRELGRLLRLGGQVDGGARMRPGRGRRHTVLVDRVPDRGDLRGRRPAAPADQPCAERPRAGCELGEVLGCRVRERDPGAAPRGEPDVRQRRQRSLAAHLGERRQCGRRPASVIRADSRDVEGGQLLGSGPRRHAAHRHRVAVEAQERHDRQARDRAHRLDRDHELLEVVEGLEHEDVGSASFEDAGLRGERLRLVNAHRADCPADPELPAGDLPRLAGELDGRRVDLLELVLEVVLCELGPVGAERVRLDQLRARVDEADVHRRHGVGGAQVRLLGAAEARDRGREDDAHPAVRDDRRPVAQPLEEARRQSTDRVNGPRGPGSCRHTPPSRRVRRRGPSGPRRATPAS